MSGNRPPRPTGRTRRLGALVAVGLTLAGCGLGRSRVKIANDSEETLVGAHLVLRPRNLVVDIGDLAPHRTARVDLPADFGEASLRFVFAAQGRQRSECGVYVEPRMFRVTITVDGQLGVKCENRLAWF